MDDECDEETQNPECVDDNIDSGLLEGRSSEVGDSWVDGVLVDGKT